MNNLAAKLNEVQKKLNAPKGQFNSFGKYHYRSCEDILMAVKPLLDGLVLTVNDDIVMVADRIYVKATATISDGETSISTSAFAREAEDKKGMDAAQVTGSTSSYARKYALNGLLLIDDNKDADHADNSAPQQSSKPRQVAKVSDTPAMLLRQCRTLGSLQEVWLAIDADDRSKYADIKDEMKAKLQEAA